MDEAMKEVKMVVEGVMGGNLPWNLVFAGVALAVAAEILTIPVLPFAVGLYLPIHLSTPMAVGGLVRLWIEKKRGEEEENQKQMIESGILYSSGLIAGEGLIGILLAVFAVLPSKRGGTVGEWLAAAGDRMNFGNIGALIMFMVLIGTLILSIQKGKEK